MVAKTLVQYGKHKIPRFIYHLTNKKNYNSMLNDGMIKTSSDPLFGNGIFATELTNLFKRWRENNVWGKRSLQEQLLNFTAKGEDELVMLKIPTSTLNHDKLAARSQNILFDWSSNDFNKIESLLTKALLKHSSQKSGWDEKFGKLIRAYYKFPSHATKKSAHLIIGIPAKDASLYKQRKQALEYIYKENIPMSQVEKIGEINVKELRKSAEYDPIRPMRSIFTALLDGTPEKKGAELLNC